ncbi:hypothetical protein [Swaminathania salitolerans]|uniref:Uncharacterized protein n=1 Tax=Swaminathania salitolerans TaxID=182838 RepID=A0A511BRH7_9PROT|nr:hypothetical protein [Swaminathania salitolerans]GBQ11361.1 hypothetical protein AA21291_0783 [Swaminathania salitolerans LMG 21291]GEL02443.1 hypothetical protein SSA02_16060 [Swaminathania salitolerans]
MSAALPPAARLSRRLLATTLLATLAGSGFWPGSGLGLGSAPARAAPQVVNAEDLDLNLPCIGRVEITVDPAMQDGVSLDSAATGGAHVTIRTGKTQGSPRVMIASKSCAPKAHVSILVAPNVGVLIHDSHDSHIVINGRLASLEASLEAGQLDADTIQSLDLSLRGTEQVHIGHLNRAAQVVASGASGLVIDHADLDAFSAQLSEASHLTITDGRFGVLTLTVNNAASTRIGGTADTATVAANGTGLVRIPRVSGALTRTGDVQIGPEEAATATAVITSPPVSSSTVPASGPTPVPPSSGQTESSTHGAARPEPAQPGRAPSARPPATPLVPESRVTGSPASGSSASTSSPPVSSQPGTSQPGSSGPLPSASGPSTPPIAARRSPPSDGPVIPDPPVPGSSSPGSSSPGASMPGAATPGASLPAASSRVSGRRDGRAAAENSGDTTGSTATSAGSGSGPQAASPRTPVPEASDTGASDTGTSDTGTSDTGASSSDDTATAGTARSPQREGSPR